MTRLAAIRRSTPLRLAGGLALIFVLATLIGFGAAYGILRQQLGQSIALELDQTIEAYTDIPDQAELEERIGEDTVVFDPTRTILLYIAEDGRRIGNVRDFPAIDGPRVISEAATSLSGPADSYLATSLHLGRGTLIAAKGREQIVELGEIFTTVALICFLPALVLGSFVGLLAARRARDRVEGIRATLREITAGRLEARVAEAATEGDDLSQIGAAVNRMAVAQADSIASLKQVSADIAHDLRTPIQRVLVLLEKLDEAGRLEPEAQHLVARARHEAEEIVRTFRALLHIAQLEGGGPHEAFRPVDLSAVAANLVEVYEPSAEESGHALTLTAPAPALVDGDRTLLGQVVANLIENALRHTPSGCHVEVAVAQGTGGVTLTVRDDGPGVPEAERESVLRRLYRLERSRTSEGSGLGLSLVAAVAELHGATLTLSDAGPGLVVTLAFPPRG